MTRSAEVQGSLSTQWSVYELRKADYWHPVAMAIAAGDANKAESVTRDAMRDAVDSFAGSMGRAEAPPSHASEKSAKAPARSRPRVARRSRT
jgi:hypothetical protein